jgi:hypothetical protein
MSVAFKSATLLPRQLGKHTGQRNGLAFLQDKDVRMHAWEESNIPARAAACVTPHYGPRRSSIAHLAAPAPAALVERA